MKLSEEFKSDNIIAFLDRLHEFCESHETIVLYGAGAIGKMILPYLQMVNIEVFSFVVSDDQAHPETVGGVPVYKISELPVDKQKCGVILTLARIHQEDALLSLKAHGFKDIFSEQLIILLFFRNFYSSENASAVGFTNRLADVEKYFDIINTSLPLPDFAGSNDDLDIISNVCLEIGDFILPAIADDFNYTDEGPYELGNVKLCDGDIVIDCGANFGIFSALAASKGCRVYAVEPSKHNVDLLLETAKLYPGAINICQTVLTDFCGTVSFIDDFASASNRISEERGISATATTLDQFVIDNNIEKVDFIKSDIEGAEGLLIKGAKNVLRKHAPKLAICTYHLPDDKEVLERLILDANPNYIIEHKWKKLYAYVPGRIDCADNPKKGI